MTANKNATRRACGSDLPRADAHTIQPGEYAELPELTDTMVARAVLKRAGRPLAIDPRQQVTIRLPATVLARWKATGKGWQTRLAEAVAKHAPRK